MGPSVNDHLRGHLREVRAALRVATAVSITLLLAAVGTRSATPETPVATARSLVVLVHGFGAGPDCWDGAIPALGGWLKLCGMRVGRSPSSRWANRMSPGTRTWTVCTPWRGVPAVTGVGPLPPT